MEELRGRIQEVGTPADISKFQDAEEEAKRLYEERADRAEWLSLAETIGRGLIHFNLANQGLKSGVDLSGVKLEPATDWDARVKRYGDEYSTELARQGRLRTATMEQDREKQRTRREGLKDELDALKAQASAVEHAEHEAGETQRAKEHNDTIIRAAGMRASGTGGEKPADRSLAYRKMKDVQDAVDKGEAAQSVLENYFATTNKKEKQKLLGDANRAHGFLGLKVPLADLDEQYNSGFWQSTQDENHAKVNNVLQNSPRLRNLKQALDSLQSGTDSGSSASPAAPSAPPAGAVRMRAPNGKIGAIPADKVRDAEARGFTRVD
jgi:hypothetical protein